MHVLIADDDEDHALLTQLGLCAARPDLTESLKMVTVADGRQTLSYLHAEGMYVGRTWPELPPGCKRVRDQDRARQDMRTELEGIATPLVARGSPATRPAVVNRLLDWESVMVHGLPAQSSLLVFDKDLRFVLIRGKAFAQRGFQTAITRSDGHICKSAVPTRAKAPGPPVGKVTSVRNEA